MKIHNCYFQDKVYKEMISLHDVFLMLGRKHELVLETSPEVGVSDWQGISDAPLSFTIEGKKFHIDLTKETKEREVKIVLSSKENDFSEWFLLHLFSPIRKEDLYGTYRCLDNKRQVLVLGEKKTSLDLDDLADDLKAYESDGFSFDPLSMEISLKLKEQVVDGVTFVAHPDFLYSPKRKTIVGACSLEAYSEEGRDEIYLIGDGDEDSTIERSSFLLSDKEEGITH